MLLVLEFDGRLRGLGLLTLHQLTLCLNAVYHRQLQVCGDGDHLALSFGSARCFGHSDKMKSVLLQPSITALSLFSTEGLGFRKLSIASRRAASRGARTLQRNGHQNGESGGCIKFRFIAIDSRTVWIFVVSTDPPTHLPNLIVTSSDLDTT